MQPSDTFKDELGFLLEQIEGAVELARANDLNTDELAHFLDWFRTVKRRCQDADVALTRTLAVLMSENVEVHGDLLVERKGSYDRKWDNESLLWTLIQDAREASVNEHGEITGSTPELVYESLKDCAAFSYWRVGKLKARGIDPDLFCEKSDELRWSVSVKGPES